MGKKVAGTVYLKLDGEQIELTGGVEVPLSATKRETIVPGFAKEEDVAPFMKFDAVKTPGVDWQKIARAMDMTGTAEFKDGSVYVLEGAYVVGDMNLNSEDGKVSMELNGVKGTWQ